MTINLNDLKDSNEFLNLILDNMGAAVLIADENFQIHQFNDAFLNLFDSAADTIASTTFGELSGCVNTILENKPCGETSACAQCVLRHSLIQTLIADAPVDRRPLERIFYIKGLAVRKYLRFTTRRIVYQGRTMILVIIFDVSDIEQQKAELERKQELINQDLNAAADIQKTLLPQGEVCVDRLQAAWRFDPCESIGGDIFNIRPLEQHRVGIYMLDVCGHGVPAALISVAASQFLLSARGLLGDGRGLVSPEAVLNHLDEAFPFERFDSYFSIVCMTLDLDRGILAYGNAGHPPPLLLRAGGELEPLSQRGPIIGFGSGKPFRQEELRLSPGDKVILYTDGITDNRSPGGKAFGKERFYRRLKLSAHRTVQELVQDVHSELQVFLMGAKPDDDISLLGLEYTGRGQPGIQAQGAEGMR